MAFGWTQIDDYIAYQLMGFVNMNAVRSNIGFIAEDILGLEDGDSGDSARFVKLGNGNTHGGKVKFNSGSLYLECSMSTEDATLNGGGIKMSGTSKIRGDRMVFNAHTRASSLSASRYLIANGTIGWKMPQAGSIMAVTWTIFCNSFTSSGTVRGDIIKNLSSSILSSDLFTISATGVQNDVQEYPREGFGIFGGNTFAQGDIIAPYLTKNSGSYTVKASCVMEVILNG